MRVTGLAGTTATSTPATARRVGSGTFTVSEDVTSNHSAPTSGLRAVSSLDVLIALQGIDDPRERRKRAVHRGQNALDMLDGLKLGMLDGSLDPSAIGRLKSVAEGLKQGSGDVGLDAILAEIELRVEVELAKAAIG